MLSKLGELAATGPRLPGREPHVGLEPGLPLVLCGLSVPEPQAGSVLPAARCLHA